MFSLIVGIIILIDLVTKWWASRWGTVSINTGVSFGLGADQPLLMVLIIGVATFMVTYFIVYERRRFPLVSGLIVGGIIANIIDRLLVGGVRDWIRIPGTTLHNNVADYALCVGLVLFLWQSLKPVPRS